ncbi:sensor histidine kinase [Paenibacillus endoradicis]|uniref:sensor histidine kinase n=1 Tax=Paenibacillus endoradicis TaxID=2972487 RepID=UPI002159A4AE|nr:sensor histidine kinase [Paenibacillus endoradicis]MCR8657019.1 sensor histidine kinase [Paenibacillus endoradicis]
MKLGLLRSFSGVLRQSRIRRRFFSAMILVSLPPLIILGYLSFNVAKETLVDNHIERNSGYLQTASEVTDLLMSNIINMNRIILSSEELRDELYASGANEGNKQEFLNVRTANKLQNIVVANLFDTQNIESICLFDRNFRSVCYGRSEQAGNYGTDETRMQIVNTEWYSEAVRAKGKEVFFGYNVLEKSLESNSFSSVKLLRDPNRLSQGMIGLLVININKSIFDQAVIGSGQNGFLVMDAFHSPEPITVYDLSPELTASIGLGESIDETVDRLQDAEYIVSQITNATTGWRFIDYVEMKTLLSQSDRIGAMTLLIAAIMAGIALLVSYFVSGTVTRPLLQLKKMIVDWAKGNPMNSLTISEPFAADEVGVIGQTFQRMVVTNQQLSESLLQSQLKEREAELRSLLSQIKPHFLYNTLDSIYFMALLEEKKDIAQMALSLSESFKLSLNKGKEHIPVFKELKHIEHYMIIQSMRYDNRFQYVEDVEEEIKSFEIMKLLLQPLVENAMYHGLEPKEGEGIIHLTGRRDGEYLIFTVSDNGVGMDDIQKTEQGYGISNVRERLSLFYGGLSKFTIRSKVNEGTHIELRFPHQDRKGDD